MNFKCYFKKTCGFFGHNKENFRYKHALIGKKNSMKKERRKKTSLKTRSYELALVQGRLHEVPLHRDDHVEWLMAANKIFNFRNTWNAICDKKPYVTWWRIMWFPNAVPI